MSPLRKRSPAVHSPRHSALRDSDSFYISVLFSQYVASILKVVSWSKMTAEAPATKPTFQAMGRKKEQRGLTSQLSQHSFRRLLGSATQHFHSHRPGLSLMGIFSHKGSPEVQSSGVHYPGLSF